MKRFLYTLWQCTWGIIQTLLGFAVFLANFKKKHYIYHGAVVTEWEPRTSVSLGLFVFLSNKTTDDNRRQILVHEYGHTVQSLLLGPLYLIVIGIPSALWCMLPCFCSMRKNRGISYFSLYTENWANRCGELVTGEKSPRKSLID